MARSMGAFVVLLVFLAGCALSHAGSSIAVSDSSNSANPIRRVVTMLQNIAKKVEEEGKKEEELYDKFMCYCKTSGADLQASISASTAEVPELQSSIEAAESSLVNTKAELQKAQEDRADAKGAMADATSQREKEHATFSATEAEYKSYLSSLAKAIPAIEKGMSGSFLLQSGNGVSIKQALVNDVTVSDYDRQMVFSFLMGGSSYVPASGEIVGILKQIEADFQKSLDDLTSTEKSAVTLYDELMAAKEKQVKALTAAIEEKTKRIGEIEVEIVNMKGQLTEIEKTLIEDKKFLAEMDTSCATKTKEWEERTKTRAEEMVAIQETIKILNDDDVLELFKKTLPSPSLIQVEVGKKKMQAKASDLIQAVEKKPFARRPELGFLALALAGKKVDFSKVMKMIDDMLAILKQEQVDDDSKKEYCAKQLDSAEDKVKEHAKTIESLELSIEDAKESIASLKAELKTLAAGITALDKSVAEATAARQEENAEYKELMSSDQAAKEVLSFAKNRLNKFYNPSLYKAPPKRELTEEEKLYTSVGGELETTTTIPGLAGTGITPAPTFVQVYRHKHRSIDGDDEFEAPPPPPATWDAYSKKAGESMAAITYIDRLIKDLDKEMTESTVDEENSQKAYETMMNQAATKRQADTKSINAKETAKADFEAQLTTDSETKTDEAKQMFAVKEYESQLHQECDWLIQNYDLRKQARADETDSLTQAKAVLAGADFSLVQKDGHQRVPVRALRGS